MFSQVFVCPRGGRGLHLKGICQQGGSLHTFKGGLPTGGVCIWGVGASASRGRGVCIQEGWADPQKTRKAGGKHPTGMTPLLFCLFECNCLNNVARMMTTVIDK